MSNRTRMLIGLLVSLFLIIPLTAIFYLGEQLLETPFPAFDVNDFLVRSLPGGVVTYGIDRMTDVLLKLDIARLDRAAKSSEQLVGILLFITIGTLFGLLYVWIAQLLHRDGMFMSSSYLSGLVLGGVVGVLVAIISTSYNNSATASQTVSTTWIVAAFVAWGLLHNWVQRHLIGIEQKANAAPPVMVEAAEVPIYGKNHALEVLDRRTFLIRMGSTAATITLFGVGIGRIYWKGEKVVGGDIQIASLNTGLQPASGTRPEYTPLEDHYRIDINSGRPPLIEEVNWNLRFHGLVENDITLTLADLRNNYTPRHQFITLGCISNRVGGDLISTTRWTGIPMKELLEQAGLKADATHIKITSEDDFYEIVNIETIMKDERVMLTYEWDGVPLPHKHGFPARIYIPDHYGMKQPKWIVDIEIMDHWEEGYWVRRGWDRDAFVRATSVIDTVAVDDMIENGDQKLIPIGGIAWAGARGISKVEVKVDDGEWEEAQLRDPLSETTWYIWRYDWAFKGGDHTFTVRCTEADGTPQIADVAGVRPSGATGYDRLEQSV